MGLPREALRRSREATCLWVTFERAGRVLGREPAPTGRLLWGPGPGSAFSAPVPGLDGAEELFRRAWGRTRLVVREGMGGELRVGSSRLALEDLEALGLLRGRGTRRGVDVPPGMAGRLGYRGFILTFEHGPAPVPEAEPEPPPRPKLVAVPKEFRRELLLREDRPFAALTAAVYLVLLVGTVTLATRPLPKEGLEPQNVSRRFARLIYEAPQAKTRARQEIMKRQEAKKAADAPVAEAEPEREKPAPEPEKLKPEAEAPKPEATQARSEPEPAAGEPGPGPGGPSPAVSRTEEVRRAVAGKGLLGLLGGRGAAAVSRVRGSTIQGGGAVSDLDQVLTTVGGLRRAPEGGGGGAGAGTGTSRGLTRGIDEAANRVASASAKVPQLEERRDVAVQAKETDQAPDAFSLQEATGIIKKTVGTYLGGLRYLYNKELRKNPDLEGKLTVSLTIAPNGTVAECRVVDSTMNAPELERAVLERIRKWTFPPVAPKPITVTYPFVFFPTM